MVGLPLPSELGAFDRYQARLAIPPPENTNYDFILAPVTVGSGQPRTWAGSLTFPPGDGWSVNTMIVIRPINTNSGKTGAAVLTGTLADCCD